VKNINCILCGCDEYVGLRTIVKDKYMELIRADAVPVKKVICARCGFVYQKPQWEGKELQDLYTRFRSNQEPSGVYLRSKEKKAIGDFSWIDRYAGGISKGKILDIGCAEGALLRILNNNGWEGYGIEPSYFGKFGKEKLGLRIENNFFEKIDFADAHFDAVSILRVLEHVSDPVKILADCRRVLREYGLLYIQTPNALRPYGEPMEFYGSQHLWLFTPSTLGLLLEKIGFCVEAVESSKEGVRIVARKTAPHKSSSDSDVRTRMRARIFLTRLNHGLHPFVFYFQSQYGRVARKLSSIKALAK